MSTYMVATWGQEGEELGELSSRSRQTLQVEGMNTTVQVLRGEQDWSSSGYLWCEVEKQSKARCWKPRKSSRKTHLMWQWHSKQYRNKYFILEKVWQLYFVSLLAFKKSKTILKVVYLSEKYNLRYNFLNQNIICLRLNLNNQKTHLYEEKWSKTSKIGFLWSN